MDDDKKKRRNCADRARYTMERRKAERGRKIDPAMSVAIQLMALFSIGLRMLPDFSPASTPALPMPAPRVPLPSPSAEPWQRYKMRPSWTQLIRDLARPVATADAQREVRSRLPVECGPWLDKVFRDEDWSSIRMHIRSGATDEDVGMKVLRDARRWKADREAELAALAAELAGGGKSGGGGSSSGAHPGVDGGRGMRF
ncbi:hypothetical protein [Rhizobium ruizarguesonis]|uniref:hypothetical protein n=1 Tax=Rhizobium ruizarguesonis TaxID=2081791 RepID=UPI001030A87F|nr:hypothetical protein [Rhizobium ruizarguesonis]TAW60512.1 hypothetical protein ELI10_38025 [Rhizobium ruizarguesonis]TAX01303.1 hypothetical protein ELI09_37915 [Rhizobium ruizarguesonis]TAX02982.1 hypothetical protein ELI08_37975 [Rhizobium ruizarguesonis]